MAHDGIPMFYEQISHKWFGVEIAHLIRGINIFYISLQGYEMVHRNFSSVSNEREKNIDWTKSILAQRKFVFPSPGYSKPLLSKIPLLYVPGFHTTVGVVVETDTSLRLFHLHSVDYEYCNTREQSKFISSKQMIEKERVGGLGIHFSNATSETLRSCNQHLFMSLKNENVLEDKWQKINL